MRKLKLRKVFVHKGSWAKDAKALITRYSEKGFVSADDKLGLSCKSRYEKFVIIRVITDWTGEICWPDVFSFSVNELEDRGQVDPWKLF